MCFDIWFELQPGLCSFGSFKKNKLCLITIRYNDGGNGLEKSWIFSEPYFVLTKRRANSLLLCHSILMFNNLIRKAKEPVPIVKLRQCTQQIQLDSCPLQIRAALWPDSNEQPTTTAPPSQPNGGWVLSTKWAIWQRQYKQGSSSCSRTHSGDPSLGHLQMSLAGLIKLCSVLNLFCYNSNSTQAVRLTLTGGNKLEPWLSLLWMLLSAC